MPSDDYRKHAGRADLKPPRWWEHLAYRTAQALLWAFNASYWNARVLYDRPMPKKPFMLCPTHRSAVDSILMGNVTSSYLHFMAKVELWKSPILGRALEVVGGFPVDRDATDRDSLKSAQRILEWGDAMVLFPEGERRKGLVIEDLHDGAAYLALKTNTPIVPVGIAGSERALQKGKVFPRPARVRIIVGEPLYPADFRVSGTTTSQRSTVSRGSIIRMTSALEEQLQSLYDRAREL